ncbi:hypothetical protein [Actinomycetospora sp. NBRC 106378]|uniref:hypothetical protein n=1 Tax=Actinomycetospora sp. NBRC 106378 TaxID=3032208 RepID=UPI0024A3A28F|nr:hypothetical protein [Actinomycetospora sp. NBRC 106378]GLZ55949.1 hypothetical protein Acsp07_55660 [Actinomycetospora sp. NBRC 106378]
MPRFAVSAWDYHEPPVPRPADEEWIDRLTALQVLARHGDQEAEAEARVWLARDPDARTVWDTVAGVCGNTADGR